MTPTLAKLGLFEIAVAALLGWAIVARLERPELLERIGVRSPRRIMQCHLDQVMMGLILVAIALAVPDLPSAIAAPVAFGTIVNPLLFLPLAFDEGISRRLPFRALGIVSFTATSGGLLAVAIYAL